MNKLLRKIQRNPINSTFSLAMIGCLALASNNVKANFKSIESVKKTTQYNAQKNLELAASQQNAESQAEIANQRYSQGCLMMVSNKGKFTFLTQGISVVDPERRTPLPKGTLVCDAFGNTGKLVPRDFDKDGIWVTVIAETAYTGSKEVIALAKKSAQETGNLATPIN